MTADIKRRDDRGAASILFAVVGVALLMATGLAVDGGRKLGALSEARDIADNAARAGAQMIDEDTYRSSGIPALDPAAATQRAHAYLATHGHTGTVTVAGAAITVTVTGLFQLPESNVTDIGDTILSVRSSL